MVTTVPAATSDASSGTREMPPSASSDGAQRSSTPVVPWAHAITGHPPAGGVPVGATTTPDTAIGVPSGLVDVYSTRHACCVPDLVLRSAVRTGARGPSGSAAGGW